MSHLFIAGSGRAGTTALVELLHACGLDTGSDELAYFDEANAGYEQYPSGQELPRVVKSPTISTGLESIISRGLDPSTIEAVLLPVRKNEDAAASRIDNFRRDGLDAKGGLWVGFYGTVPVYTRPSDQRRETAEAVCQLLLTTAEHQIPIITLAFPRFVANARYAWERLQPVLGDVDEDRFLAAHTASMRPDLVHSQPHYTRAQLRRLDLRWALQYWRRAARARLRLHGPVAQR